MAVFGEVARQGSFNKAAAELGLSRSTVSHHVSGLEQALGVRLLERTTRSVRLTGAGLELSVYAFEIMERWQDAVERTRAHAEIGKGRLSVTCPAILCRQFVVDAVVTLRSEYPDLEVVIRSGPTNLNLYEEHIDVAIRSGPLPDSGHGSRLLVKSQHIIVAAPQLADRWAHARAPAELSDGPWVAFNRRGLPINRFTSPAGESVVAVSAADVAVSSSDALLDFTEGGAGFAVIPEFLAAPGIHAGRLTHVLPQWSAGSVAFHAVTASPRPTEKKVRRFIDLLIERFAAVGSPR